MKNSDQVKEQHRPTRNIADTLSAATSFDAPAFQLQAEEEEEMVQTKPALSVQTKLTVGAPDDMYEKEADRVAEQVVSAPQVQRADTAESKPEDEKLLQTKPMVQFKVSADGGEEVSPDIQRQIQGAQGGGSPLPNTVQSRMEGAFGAGFDSVRVHTGSQANELNESLNARAFTTGSDIFFKGGEFSPESGEGQKLLAHELTHVVQQGAANKMDAE